MKVFLLLSVCMLSGMFVIKVCGQEDESRQASGLPRMIGENSSDKNKTSLTGKLTLLGFDDSQPKPNIFVIVYIRGVQIDRRQVDDKGFYYVPEVPRDLAVLAVEVNGEELARQQLPLAPMGSIRQDLTINLGQKQSSTNKTGVISAKNLYSRSAENEKIYNKAIVAVKEKNFDNAVKFFDQLLKNDSKDFVAWNELGNIYFRNEKFTESESAYQKSLEQKPDFTVALVNLGKLYLAQKQAEKAVSILSKAVEIEPYSPDAQQYLGESYLYLKKGSLAVGYLNQAIKLAPIEKAEIHLRLATLYNAANLRDRAVAEYKLFLEKVPLYPGKDKIEKYIKDNSTK